MQNCIKLLIILHKQQVYMNVYNHELVHEYYILYIK